MAVDIKEERFVTATLRLVLQNVIDVAAHIVADDRLGAPQTLRQTFLILARAERLEPSLAESLGRMAGLRNLLVHEYAALDLERVRSIVENDLRDIEAFVETVRARL